MVGFQIKQMIYFLIKPGNKDINLLWNGRLADQTDVLFFIKPGNKDINLLWNGRLSDQTDVLFL